MRQKSATRRDLIVINTAEAAVLTGSHDTRGSTVVYLARHATPDWNRRDIRYDVPPGPDLVPQGEAEAAKLGEFLREKGVTRICASPLLRTQRTAAIAAEVAGISAEIVEAVAEYRREENDDLVFARLQPFFEQVWAAAEAGPIAIVTHGGPVRVLLERLGADSDMIWHYRRQFDHQNPLPPAGAWELTRSANPGRWYFHLVFSPGPYTEYLPEVAYV